MSSGTHILTLEEAGVALRHFSHLPVDNLIQGRPEALDRNAVGSRGGAVGSEDSIGEGTLGSIALPAQVDVSRLWQAFETGR